MKTTKSTKSGNQRKTPPLAASGRTSHPTGRVVGLFNPINMTPMTLTNPAKAGQIYEKYRCDSEVLALLRDERNRKFCIQYPASCPIIRRDVATLHILYLASYILYLNVMLNKVKHFIAYCLLLTAFLLLPSLWDGLGLGFLFAQWVSQTSGTTNPLTSVFFINENIGYAVGWNGTILKTTNGGSNWTSQTTTGSLQSVYFLDADNGYVVGEGPTGGIILKTTNGGNTWTAQTSGTNQGLWAVHFFNVNNGYAVGSFGTILKTTTGGSNWTAQTSGTTKKLESVYFLNTNTGYVVGENGTILKTTDGGTNWTALSSGTSSTLRSVYFIDASTGYAVGGDFGTSAILKTTNGGNTWTPHTIIGMSNQLESVYFPDANTGYAVGWYGTIIKTADAGQSWYVQTSPTTLILYSVYFISANIGYAVGGDSFGDNSVILKTTNGGEGIEENKQEENNSVIIYPNPFSTLTNLRFTIYDLRFENAEIVLYNLLGREVFTSSIQYPVSSISVSLESGMYFYVVKSDRDVLGQGKVVIE